MLLSGIITKQDEVDCVCGEIRRAAGKVRSNLDVVSLGTPPPPPPLDGDATAGARRRQLSLADLEIGDILAKGCNAAVCAARWARRQWEGVSEAFERVEGPSEATTATQQLGEEYPLAVKMMFNYEAESNAAAIMDAMQR